MELRSLTPDMPQLLSEMGINYDPQRLADALKGREVEITGRAAQVATQLGGCIAGIVKVGACTRSSTLFLIQRMLTWTTFVSSPGDHT